MRKTKARRAVIATATVLATIGLAGPAQADPPFYDFQSPSGNISCALTVDYKNHPYANCTVLQSAYAEQSCQRPGLVIPQFTIGPGDPALMPGCEGTNGGRPNARPTLDYGQTQSLDTLTCDSEPAGMTCTDSSTGHFFRVSQESYQLG